MQKPRLEEIPHASAIFMSAFEPLIRSYGSFHGQFSEIGNELNAWKFPSK